MAKIIKFPTRPAEPEVISQTCTCLGYRVTMVRIDIKESGNRHAVYGPCICTYTDDTPTTEN
jgi:hypothetical protein